jgi:phage terminase small subunit
MSKAKALPIKRQKFVEVLVATGNQTEAARQAGYSLPTKEGSRLVRFADVAAAISERLAKVQRRMGADEIRARLELMSEGKIPTRIVKGMTPKGPVKRIEYNSESATETLARIDKMLGDGMPAQPSQINVAVVLPQIPVEKIDELLGYLEKAKALDVEGRAV